MKNSRHTLAEGPERFDRLKGIASRYVFNDFDPDSAGRYLQLARTHVTDVSSQIILWNLYKDLYLLLDPALSISYMDSMEALIASEPDKIEVRERVTYLHSFGNVYRAVGQLERAGALFREAIALARNDTALQVEAEEAYNHSFAAINEFELGDTASAFAYADSSIALYLALEDRHNNPSFMAHAWGVKADLLQRVGDHQSALELVERSLSRYPLNEEAWSVYVETSHHLGLHRQALEAALREVERQPDPGLTIGHLERIARFGEASAAALGDDQARLQLMDSHISYLSTMRKTGGVTIVLARYIQRLSEERQALLLEQKQQELALETERKKRSDLIGLATGGSLCMIVVFAVLLYRRLLFTRSQKRQIEDAKRLSDELLLNILPTEVADELKERGRTEARSFDSVTILFTDFVSFAETAKQFDARELVHELNIYFRTFDGIAMRYGIEKIKTIGDAYLAAGGLSSRNTLSAGNTVRAALDMTAFVQDRFEKTSDSGRPAFIMRIGIHTGPVVAGVVGLQKFQYDIWGDTVNTASRMESHGVPGRVNVSHATYELLKDDPDFVFEARGRVETKGMGEKRMWLVSYRQDRSDAQVEERKEQGLTASSA